MKCPKCRCEVGNQSVCPYCGATVYIDGNAWANAEYVRRSAMYMNDPRNSLQGHTAYDAERNIQRLEKKVNMLLILQCGIFALNVLIL